MHFKKLLILYRCRLKFINSIINLNYNLILKFYNYKNDHFNINILIIYKKKKVIFKWLACRGIRYAPMFHGSCIMYIMLII